MCKQQRNKDGEKKRIDYFNGKTQGRGCITLCSTVSDPIMFETWPIIMFLQGCNDKHKNCQPEFKHVFNLWHL